MRTGYLHIAALLSLNGLVSSTPTPHHDAPPQASSALEAPIPGYKVFVPEWEAQAHPHGEKMRINGTAEEVLLKLRSINPDYDRHFGLDQPDDEVDEGGVQKRQGTNVQFARVICNNFPKADATRVAQGVAYLRRVRGQPENSPGPETCGRVSCSYNTAIWWCNDVSVFFSPSPHPVFLRRILRRDDG